MTCNECGGSRFAAEPHGLDTHAHPDLTGLMLACAACHRPIRLLHKSGLRSTPIQHRRDVNRALRAKRRLEARR